VREQGEGEAVLHEAEESRGVRPVEVSSL